MDSPQRDRKPEITIDLEEQGSLDLQQHGLDPDDANRRLHEWAQQAAESAAAMRETAPRLQQARSAERVLTRASRALNALVAAEEEEACVDAAVDEAQRAAVVAAVEEEVRASTRGVGQSGDEEPMGVVAKQKAAKAKALAASLRKWLRIDSNGETSTIGSSKYKLAQRLGVQPRDLRFLELQVRSISGGYASMEAPLHASRQRDGSWQVLTVNPDCVLMARRCKASARLPCWHEKTPLLFRLRASAASSRWTTCLSSTPRTSEWQA